MINRFKPVDWAHTTNIYEVNFANILRKEHLMHLHSTYPG